MFTIEEIVDALKVTRGEFATIFLQVQDQLPVDLRVRFEAVGLSASDREAYREALRYAQRRGWLDAIVDAVIAGGFETGRLTTKSVDRTDPTAPNPARASLEAMTQEVAGFIEPFVLGRGVIQAMKSTAKISIDGVARGTGILITPNLVLTAWHVVEPLFASNAGQWQLIEPATRALEVEFDDVLQWVRPGAMSPPRTERVRSHADWLVAFCSCHARELGNTGLPNDLRELAGCWDYAIIKLDQPLERRWVPLDARAGVPKSGQYLFLFQHPAGQPQKAATSIVAAGDGLANVIPNLRFLHSGNTLQGSSGGPCFNKGFELIGIHQGAWMGPGVTATTNCGIPIARIAEHIQEHFGTLPELAPCDKRVWSLGAQEGHEPVIGRDGFQVALWQMAASGRRKLLLITGQPGTGKSFCIRLLKALLPDENHLKVTLDAAAISTLDAPALAARLCQEAGTALGPLPPPTEPNSTGSVWLRDAVLDAVMRKLDEARSGRLVWLLLKDLNKSEIQGPQASDLLLLIYQQSRSSEWLRVVLDGMQGSIPAGLDDLVERQRMGEIQEQDVAACLRRTLDSRELEVSELTIKKEARRLIGVYHEVWDRGPAGAAETLRKEFETLVQEYMDAAQAE